MDKRKLLVSLCLIFLLALALRFLYFPNNIYFGFDQARDAFTSSQILRGDFKIVGPPTAIEGLFHGPLYYYFYAPLYFISHGSPLAVSAFLRIFNASIIFLVFILGVTLFNKWVGLISALFFAVSFEQTQYAIYFNHPPLAVATVLLFYLGLIQLFFKKKQMGLVLVCLGLGLSLQFEFSLIYLFGILFVSLLVFRNYIPKINAKTILISLGVFLLTVSTFLITEIKFNFRSISSLPKIFIPPANNLSQGHNFWDNILIINQRFITDNFLSNQQWSLLVLMFFLSIGFLLFRDKSLRPKIIFLLIWLLGGSIPYINNRSSTPLYYYSIAASVSLLILASLFIQNFFQKYRIVLLILLIAIVSNLGLIFTHNPKGSISTINVQSGMLLGDEMQVLDYLYSNSHKEEFSINALTMPLFVNTTWSYLFEWYGYQKYGYLPIWGGELAAGYSGNLPVIRARSKLPKVQFLIIEPTRGIQANLIKKFIEGENYFTRVKEEQKIGDFIVQLREPF